MKFTFFFLVLFTISSCATQARRRGTNFSDIETDSETTPTEKEALPTKAEDRAPKGEIELGLTGESTEPVIIENSGDVPIDKSVDFIEEKKLTGLENPCVKNPKTYNQKLCVELQAREALGRTKIENGGDDDDKSELIIDAPSE